MPRKNFTQLPTTASANTSDIIAAVQGGDTGDTVQMTLLQVITLANQNNVLFNSGNPNGTLAGIIHQLAYDTTNQFLWVCTTTGSTSTAVWKTCVGTLTNGQVLIGSTGLSPVAASLTAGTNVTITPGAGTITIAATGTAGFSWTEVTGTTQAGIANKGYIASNAGLVTISLPTTAAVGDVFNVLGKGAGGWSISQAAGQQILGTNLATTVGVAGNLSSTTRYNSVYLVCSVANTTFTMFTAPGGILTPV